MKKRREVVLAAAVIVFSVMLAGCGESKEAREARLQGVEQMNAGDYANAVVSFDKALEEADGVVNTFELDILKYRGEAEFQLEDYEAAAHTYGILAEVDGEKTEYLYYKAASEAEAGDLEAAKEDYNKALADEGAEGKTPGAKLALTAIAGAARRAGDIDGAISFCQSALDLGSSDPEIYNQMGMSLMEAKRYDEAIGYFEQGAAAGEGEAVRQLKYNEGAAYEYKGDFAKALEIFKAYEAAYGSTPETEKEIAFLESR